MKRSSRQAGRGLLAASVWIAAAIGVGLPAVLADAPADPAPSAVEGPAPSPPPEAPAAGTPPAGAAKAQAEAPQAEAPQAGAPPAEPGRKRAGRIRGTVTDALKKALPGLLVTLSSRAEPDVLRVTGTNEKGQYLFPELPPGLYDLKVQADGFLDAGKESIEIRPPFQNIVDVQLKPLDKGGPATPGARPTAGAGPTGGAAPAAGAGSTSGGGAASGAAVPQGAGQAGESGGEVAPAPPPVTVRGRFVDQDRRPLYEVSVVLSALQGKAIYQAFSGDDGVFEIPGVVPGRYHVIVRSPGHVPLDLRSVEVLGKNGISVSLMLVDYPLNFKASQQSLTPVEAPRPAPGPPEAVGGAGSAARDGEHAPEQGKPPARDGSPEDRPGG